jgi:hypothetical protein
MKVSAGTTCALTKYSHAVRVSAEQSDIVTHPAQCCHLVFHSIVTRTRCIFSTQESCEHSHDLFKAAYKVWSFLVIFCLLLFISDITLVLVIFSYSLLKSQICIHIEPGFLVPCKLLTDIINFFLAQLSYVFFPRTLFSNLWCTHFLHGRAFSNCCILKKSVRHNRNFLLWPQMYCILRHVSANLAFFIDTTMYEILVFVSSEGNFR